MGRTSNILTQKGRPVMDGATMVGTPHKRKGIKQYTL
jgi:hypothetical protein